VARAQDHAIADIYRWDSSNCLERPAERLRFFWVSILSERGDQNRPAGARFECGVSCFSGINALSFQANDGPLLENVGVRACRFFLPSYSLRLSFSFFFSFLSFAVRHPACTAYRATSAQDSGRARNPKREDSARRVHDRLEAGSQLDLGSGDAYRLAALWEWPASATKSGGCGRVRSACWNPKVLLCSTEPFGAARLRKVRACLHSADGALRRADCTTSFTSPSHSSV